MCRGDIYTEHKMANRTLGRKNSNYTFSYQRIREGKTNFKEMEKSGECQENFSMRYSSLCTYNLYALIQMLCIKVMGFNGKWACI